MTKFLPTSLAPTLLAVTLVGGTIVAFSRAPLQAYEGTTAQGHAIQDGTDEEGTGQDGTGKKDAEQTGEADAEEGEKSVLHESMEVLQKNMKALRKMMRNPEETEALLKMCVEMQGAALQGFMNPPASPDGLQGSELLAYQADFKKRMLSVAGTLVDLELAADAGDADTMKTLYRSLGEHKKEGHDIYIE